MGKVNQLFQDEQQKRYEELVRYHMEEGFTQDEAEEIAFLDLEEELRLKSQFGVGA